MVVNPNILKQETWGKAIKTPPKYTNPKVRAFQESELEESAENTK